MQPKKGNKQHKPFVYKAPQIVPMHANYNHFQNHNIKQVDVFDDEEYGEVNKKNERQTLKPEDEDGQISHEHTHTESEDETR